MDFKNCLRDQRGFSPVALIPYTRKPFYAKLIHNWQVTNRLQLSKGWICLQKQCDTDIGLVGD
jgi:hypothetical protein